MFPVLVVCGVGWVSFSAQISPEPTVEQCCGTVLRQDGGGDGDTRCRGFTNDHRRRRHLYDKTPRRTKYFSNTCENTQAERNSDPSPPINGH